MKEDIIETFIILSADKHDFSCGFVYVMVLTIKKKLITKFSGLKCILFLEKKGKEDLKYETVIFHHFSSMQDVKYCIVEYYLKLM